MQILDTYIYPHTPVYRWAFSMYSSIPPTKATTDVEWDVVSKPASRTTKGHQMQPLGITRGRAQQPTCKRQTKPSVGQPNARTFVKNKQTKTQTTPSPKNPKTKPKPSPDLHLLAMNLTPKAAPKHESTKQVLQIQVKTALTIVEAESWFTVNK